MPHNLQSKSNFSLLPTPQTPHDIYQMFLLYPVLFHRAILLFYTCSHVAAPYFPDCFPTFPISHLTYQVFQLITGSSL